MNLVNKFENVEIKKALSIKQPFASLIATGIKDIENRTWKTNFRGRIFIHASAKTRGNYGDLNNEQRQIVHQAQADKMAPTNLFEPLRAIIGEVSIIDCVINHPSIWAEKTCQSLLSDDYIEKITYNWILADAVLYDKPILNIKGQRERLEFK